MEDVQMINVPAEVWVDGTRIDRGREAGEKAGELSALDGTIELLVPIDIGPLGQVITVRFPMSALMRLNQA